MPPLTEFQRVMIGFDLVSRDQIVDPETGEIWDPIDGVTPEQLAEALDAIEPGDTFVTNVTETTVFLTEVTQVITNQKNQNNGVAGLDGSAKVSKNQLPADILQNAISFIIDGGGSAITTGVKGEIHFPFACVITGWMILPDQSGSIVIDLWKDTYANFPPVDADSICAGNEPTLAATTKAQDLDVANWSGEAITADQMLRVNVDSVTTVTRVTLVLLYTRT